MQLSTSSQKAIKTSILILAGVATLVGGSLLYIWFGFVKPYADGLERPRVPLLKKIEAAQHRFRNQDLDKDGSRDYGDLKELMKARLLTDKELHKAGIVFIEPATSDRNDRWWAIAQPLHPSQGRSFFVNHTGKIYYSDDRPWNLESRINRKTGEVPAGMQELKIVSLHPRNEDGQ